MGAYHESTFLLVYDLGVSLFASRTVRAVRTRAGAAKARASDLESHQFQGQRAGFLDDTDRRATATAGRIATVSTAAAVTAVPPNETARTVATVATNAAGPPGTLDRTSTADATITRNNLAIGDDHILHVTDDQSE